MGKFEKIFSDTIKDIEDRAKEAGTTITQLCKDADIARATPDRWKKRAPNSVVLIDKMLKALEVAERK